MWCRSASRRCASAPKTWSPSCAPSCGSTPSGTEWEASIFDPALVEALRAHNWPGNVRELENTIARLLALAPDERDHPGALAIALGRRVAVVDADDRFRATRGRGTRFGVESRLSSGPSSPRPSREPGATRARPPAGSVSRGQRSSRSCTSTDSSAVDRGAPDGSRQAGLPALVACSRSLGDGAARARGVLSRARSAGGAP